MAGFRTVAPTVLHKTASVSDQTPGITLLGPVLLRLGSASAAAAAAGGGKIRKVEFSPERISRDDQEVVDLVAAITTCLN